MSFELQRKIAEMDARIAALEKANEPKPEKPKAPKVKSEPNA
jgi:hypothetical protein